MGYVAFNLHPKPPTRKDQATCYELNEAPGDSPRTHRPGTPTLERPPTPESRPTLEPLGRLRRRGVRLILARRRPHRGYASQFARRSDLSRRVRCSTVGGAPVDRASAARFLAPLRHLPVVSRDGRIPPAEARLTHGRNQMPVRLKDRFEVFKRDGFTCQYCGRKTPQVVLEVDHIIPVLQGGSDEIENLVTACWDCNHGKGARGLDDRAPVVNVVEQTELIQEKAAQLAAYNEAKRADRAARELTYTRVRNHWFEVWNEKSLERYYMPWENVLRSAIDKLGEVEVMDAMDITGRRFNYVTTNAVRYFGGIIKSKVAEAEGRVTQCTICGERMILTAKEAHEGIDGWYHTGCAQPKTGP